MISASINIHCYPNTVADVRQWLAQIDSLGLPDSTPMDDGLLFVYIDRKKVEFIECGDHIPDGKPLPQDLLVYLHDHPTDHHRDVDGKPE